MNFWDDLLESDEIAAQYMETYGEGPGSEARSIIGAFINDGESVLDVGCGPGWNLDHFTEYGPKIDTYKGLDYSERFVRVANQRAIDKGYANGPYFFQGDARHLDEPDSSWDVVILQDVLDHTPGYEEVVPEALRVARKRIIVSFWRGQMRDDYENDNYTDKIVDDGNDGWTGEYSRTKWEDYLDELGFFWMEMQSPPGANRWHRFYFIDKEETL